jgi:hypothetical protein
MIAGYLSEPIKTLAQGRKFFRSSLANFDPAWMPDEIYKPKEEKRVEELETI